MPATLAPFQLVACRTPG